MAGVDVVAAVDVLLVDGEAGAGEQLEHALQDHQDLKNDDTINYLTDNYIK